MGIVVDTIRIVGTPDQERPFALLAQPDETPPDPLSP